MLHGCGLLVHNSGSTEYVTHTGFNTYMHYGWVEISLVLFLYSKWLDFASFFLQSAQKSLNPR